MYIYYRKSKTYWYIIDDGKDEVNSNCRTYDSFIWHLNHDVKRKRGEKLVLCNIGKIN